MHNRRLEEEGEGGDEMAPWLTAYSVEPDTFQGFHAGVEGRKGNLRENYRSVATAHLLRNPFPRW